MPKKNSSSGLLIVAVLVAVVIIAVASLDDPVLAQTTTTLTLTGSQFDMVGIFEIVQVPCASNSQCNPQYWLAGTDGNSYQLLFIPLECPVGVACSTAALPNQGERIEVKGSISYNTQGSCMLNGQATPCQPIGTVIVSSWNPATSAPTQTTVTLSGSMTNLNGRLSYDGTVYTLTVGPSITPPCCYSSQGCAVPMYLILYQLDFSQASLKPTSSDNGRLITVSGTSSNVGGMGQTILVQSWSYYTPPSCPPPVSMTYTTQSCTNTITVTLTSGQPYPPLAPPLPGSCYAFVTVVTNSYTTIQLSGTQSVICSCAMIPAHCAGSWTVGPPPCDCPICVSPSNFPNRPQSLSEVPRFLTQFWAWVSCRVFGHCS